MCDVTQRDFLRDALVRNHIDYDDALEYMQNNSYTSDVLVYLAYLISCDYTLTTDEVSELTKMITIMAVEVIRYNISQSVLPESAQEAHNDALLDVIKLIEH